MVPVASDPDRQIPRPWLCLALPALAVAVAMATGQGAVMAAPDRAGPADSGPWVGPGAVSDPAPEAAESGVAVPGKRAAWSESPTTPALGAGGSGAAAIETETRAPVGPGVGTGPIAPVPTVDLVRYSGLWHELARVPNRFQRRCARESLAVYGLLAHGRLGVLNQCRRARGRVDQVRGVAVVVDPVANSRLRVSLVDLLGWRPFWGDYWIIGLDPEYRWAIVGSPDRRYGWILARRRALDPQSWRTIASIIKRQGYRPSDFQPSAP